MATGIDKRDTSRAGLERRLRCGWRIRERQRAQFNRLAPGLPPAALRAFRADFYRRHGENDSEVNRLLTETYWREQSGGQGEPPPWQRTCDAAMADTTLDVLVPADRPVLALPATLADPGDADPAENFETDWTETDVAANRLALVTTTATVTNLDDDEAARVVRDMGAAYFGIAWAHRYHFKVTVKGASYNVHWAVSNVDSTYGDWYNNARQATWTRWTGDNNYAIWSGEGSGSATTALALNTDYWPEVVRTGAGGVTITCYIYSNAGRTSLAATIATTLPNNRTYRYGVVCNGWALGSGGTASSFVVDSLDFQEAVSSSRRRRLICGGDE